MRVRLISLAAVVLMIILPIQPGSAATQDATQNEDLPAALYKDIFDDLPFEQRRQALREEVEQGSQKSLTPLPSAKYNWLIR